MKKKIGLCVLAGVLILGLFLSLLGFTWHDNWTDRQNQAHEIAELARAMGLPESNPIIVECQRIWLEDQAADPTTDVEDSTPEDEKPSPVVETEPEPAVDLWSGVLPYEVTYNPDTETVAVMLAKVVRGEARGIWSQAEQAMVIWTVLNRVDAGMYSTVYGAITAPYQFAYNAYASTYDDYGRDLTALARDVLYRWQLEKQGQTNVGRVLPLGYCWYSGDGRHNYFRNSYRGSGALYFGLESPYDS